MHRSAENNVAVRGARFTVEWAIDAAGRMPGREFFLSLSKSDQDKMITLFLRLAEVGEIKNRERFQKLTDFELWEFKNYQLRFFGDFRPGRRFVIASGVRKKQDKAKRSDIDTALRILREYQERANP